MPFRNTFECLWCGAAWQTRADDDLEGWAQLCATCLGKAGENSFTRFRLKAALAERAAASDRSTPPGPATAHGGSARATIGAAHATEGAGQVGGAGAGGGRPLDAQLVAYYEARAAEYDDWYLRRGRYDRGTIDNMAWSAELDGATTWLDRLPWRGTIVELAAGTGWWSPLLVARGDVWLYDAAEAPLDRARQRLVAHRLRAHLHIRDAWAEPDERAAPADGLFTGFWLSHVDRDRLPGFLGLVHRWLKPGGLYAFVDSRPDPASGAIDHSVPSGDRSVRRLADGRTYTIPKVYYEPTELAEALSDAGFSEPRVSTTGRFFLLGSARA